MGQDKNGPQFFVIHRFGRLDAMTEGMKILIAIGSKRGGTVEIGEWLRQALQRAGFEAELKPAKEVRQVDGYDAVIVGGSLYMFRWHRDAQRFVENQAAALRTRDVWFFSSGPLDDSSGKKVIPPLPNVSRLMLSVGAHGHATFGGRMEPGSSSLPVGDWRDRSQVEAWAATVALALKSIEADPRPRLPLAATSEPRAWLMVGLSATIGLSAVLGGAGLVARPDGSLLRLPFALLEHSPFQSFLVPGLFLMLAVGVAHLWATWMYWRQSDFAPLASLVSGGVLLGWMTAQVTMMRSLHPLQILFLILAVGLVVHSAKKVAAFMGLLGLRPSQRMGG